MSPEIRKRFIIIVAVVAGCIASLIPINKRINLGLDLKGGMYLILKVENDKLPTMQAKEDAVLKSMEVLRNRIDGLGVAETLLQRQGDNQILLQLPGVTDRDKALAMIGRVARLEFHLVDGDESHLKDALSGHVPDGEQLMVIKSEGDAPVLINKDVAMGGEGIKDAKVDFATNGLQPKITMSFNDKGTKDFGDLTTAHVNERLAIVLDNEVLSAPNIREPILSGDAEITGDFKVEEASLLALALRTGALPVPMTIEEERTVGPLLGKDSIEAGIRATVLGGLAIVFFMCIYYFVGGFIASAALGINLLMILGSMGLLNILMPDSQVTLTLPGIAGIILTQLLNAGADKVSMNTSAVNQPDLIRQAANLFGAQCIVVAIDAKRTDDHWQVFTHGGRTATGLNAVKWAKAAESRGAGEILLTSMDADGTKNGFDVELTKAITEAVNIPVIASGGAGKLEDFYDVFAKAGADAALAASVFHYGEISIPEVKSFLKQKKVSVR